MSPRRPSNQDHLDALEFLLRDQAAIEQLAEDWAEGFPTGAGQGRGPTGGHSDRTAGSVVAPDNPCRECGADTPCRNHPDPKADRVWASREGHGLAEQLNAILEHIANVKYELAKARIAWARLRPTDHHVAEAKARQLDSKRTGGSGPCQVAACETFCTGGVNDRLKAGLCPKHYMAWWRNLRADDPMSRDVFLRTADGCVVTNETAGDARHAS